MPFTTMVFVFYFLPIVLAAYFISPRFFRNTLLVVASLFFYMWGAGALLLVLLLSIAVNYGFGILIENYDKSRQVTNKRVTVTIAIIFNVGILGYFKYANFFVDQINAVGGQIEWTRIALPIGISFYTFQAISYIIDVARHRLPAMRNPIDFALFKSLFPQLIAGPIVRYHEIAPQLHDRDTKVSDFAEGVVRFAHGFAKKLLIADPLGELAGAAFGAPGELTFATAWVGVLAYTFQIYFDFSAYSDMAIGLSRMFGFRIPENFRRPYSALSITDFWRRWHITLSNWMRDYLYIPLGGSRVAPARAYLNLFIVFFVTGLWHGANWTFILWGMYHGAILIIERVTGLRDLPDNRAVVVRRGVTFVLVMFGWVLFRADTVEDAMSVYAAMFTPDSAGFSVAMELAINTWNLGILGLAALVVLLPGWFVGGRYLTETQGTLVNVARAGVLLIALPWATLRMMGGSFSPFLYFQF